MRQKNDHRAHWPLPAMVLAGLTLQNVMWFAPASLLPVIMANLGLTMAQGGLLLSVVCLVAAITGPFSGYFVAKWGIGKCFCFAMALLCAACLGMAAAGGFFALLLCRMLFGVGFGVSLSLAATAAVQWLPAEKRPYLNAVYAILPYLAAAANFLLSIKLFTLLGDNWRITLAIPGLVAAALLLLWGLLAQKATAPLAPKEKMPYSTLVRHVLAHRQVRLICLADACDMWGFQFLSSFLPTFLYKYGGHGLEEASRLTAIFPLAGIAAGLFFGFLMGKTGHRKIFTWPMHLMIFTGTLLIAFGSGATQVAGILLAGVGNAGWAPALYTMPMEFEDITGAKVGAVFSIMLSLGYLAAFLSPIVGGFVADHIGLKGTLALFSSFALGACLLTLALKETTPRKAL